MSDLSNSDNSAEISMEKSLREKKRDLSTDEAEEDLRREAHSSSERERRKKMRLYMRELEDLVPSLHDVKADKATIVEETMKYIKTLEDIVEKLEKMKREKLESASNTANNPTDGSSSSMATPAGTSVLQNPIGFKTWIFPNVVVGICGEEAQFGVFFPKNEELFSAIFSVLHKHKIKVLSVNITSNDTKSSYKIRTISNKQNSEDQVAEEFSFEETCKEAAREIYLLSPM